MSKGHVSACGTSLRPAPVRLCIRRDPGRGHPVLLPPVPWDPREVLEVVDALVLTGGPDVGPYLWAEPHDQTDPPARNAIAGRSPSATAPSTGLAVAGHLPRPTGAQRGPGRDAAPASPRRARPRRPPAVPGRTAPNQVTLKPGSRAASILGERTEGRCHHHQAVDRLGRGMEAVGFAVDGTVEAVEITGRDFALGVQWHPKTPRRRPFVRGVGRGGPVMATTVVNPATAQAVAQIPAPPPRRRTQLSKTPSGRSKSGDGRSG